MMLVKKILKVLLGIVALVVTFYLVLLIRTWI